MSATTQVTTFSDLYTDLLNRARIDTTLTASVNQAKRYINIGLQDMHVGYGEQYSWAERTAILRTQAPYSTGTVTIVQGSTSLAGTDTVWNTNNAFAVKPVRAGGKIVISGTNEVYEVSSVSSDTALTLATRYVGDDVSAGTYLYYEDEYDLDAAFLRPLDMQFFDTRQAIPFVQRTQFRRNFIRPSSTGKVRQACIVERAFLSNTTPRRRVLVYMPPDGYYQIPYSFVTSNLAVSSAGVEAVNLSSDSDEPIVPLQYRHAIVLHALYCWYRDKKNDNRANEVKAQFDNVMTRIIGDVEVGGRRPQIVPVRGGYVRQAVTPYRRGRGRHTLGTAFDEFRD